MTTARRLFVVTLLALLLAPPLATAQTPASTPSSVPFACDDLASYWDDVYDATKPDVTLEEEAIARAARNGVSAYRKMSYTELHIAQLYYQQWAGAMSDVPASMIPDGLDEFHEIYVIYIQAQSDAILAYLDDDPTTYNDILDATWERAERRYEIERTGVEQCGDTWIDAMGEPSDPTPDATPRATPD